MRALSVIATFDICALSTVAVSLTASIILEGYRRTRRAATIKHREPVGEHELWSRYYRDSGISEVEFCRTWKEVCSQARLDPHRVRPDDTISTFVQRNPIYGGTDEWGDLLGEIAIHFRRVNHPINFEQIQTVDDVVRIFISYEHSKVASLTKGAQT